VEWNEYGKTSLENPRREFSSKREKRKDGGKKSEKSRHLHAQLAKDLRHGRRCYRNTSS